jgi:hypothetical protein
MAKSEKPNIQCDSKAGGDLLQEVVGDKATALK